MGPVDTRFGLGVEGYGEWAGVEDVEGSRETDTTPVGEKRPEVGYDLCTGRRSNILTRRRPERVDEGPGQSPSSSGPSRTPLSPLLPWRRKESLDKRETSRVWTLGGGGERKSNRWGRVDGC